MTLNVITLSGFHYKKITSHLMLPAREVADVEGSERRIVKLP
jgi:hypothetical protein